MRDTKCWTYPPSYDYEVKLEVMGANYTETVPINKTIAAGAQELITIRLGLGKSPAHISTSVSVQQTRRSIRSRFIWKCSFRSLTPVISGTLACTRETCFT